MDAKACRTANWMLASRRGSTVEGTMMSRTGSCGKVCIVRCLGEMLPTVARFLEEVMTWWLGLIRALEDMMSLTIVANRLELSGKVLFVVKANRGLGLLVELTVGTDVIRADVVPSCSCSCTT